MTDTQLEVMKDEVSATGKKGGKRREMPCDGREAINWSGRDGFSAPIRSVSQAVVE